MVNGAVEGEVEPRVAAIRYRPGDRIEEFLGNAARQMQARGLRVAGLIQHSLRSEMLDRCTFEMEDLRDGRRYRISQDLGSGSEACSIDQAAIAAASVVLRLAIEARPDVVIVNKFGGLEAAGAGLREEMNLLVAEGIALLTTVNDEYAAAWRDYAGEEGSELPMDIHAVLAWVANRTTG